MSICSRKYLFFFLIFLVLRIFLLVLYDFNHISGDALAYFDLARSGDLVDFEKYFNVSDEYLVKINQYRMYLINIFPYHDINSNTFWEPGYPLLLTLILKLTSSNLLVQIVQYILSFIILYILFKMISPFTKNKWVEVVFLFIGGIHPFFLGHPLLFYTEILDAFLIILIYYLLSRERKTKYDYLKIGIVCGLLAITESFYFPLLCLIPFIAFILSKKVKNFLLIFIPLVVITGPVFYHNYIYTDGAFLLSTKSSYNFWLDNNFLEISNYDQLEICNPLPQDYFTNKENYPHIRKPCEVKMKDQNKCEQKQAIKFALDNKILFLERMLIKWTNLWSPNIFAFNAGFNTYMFNLSDSKSNILNNIFVGFEVIVIFLFACSIPILFNLRAALIKIIFTHLIYFHAVIAWGHGMVRYKYSLFPVVLLCILLASCNVKRVNYRSKKTILIFTLSISFFLYTMITKLGVAWRV